MLTTHDAEEHATMPHVSPLQRVQSLGRDEGSITLSELTVLCTNLSNKVKKLEQTVKSTQARRRTMIVVSDDDEGLEDLSKQERMIEEIDEDTSTMLVTPTKVSSQSDQSEDHLKVLSAAKVLADAARKRREAANINPYTRRKRMISTASGDISTAEEPINTAGVSKPISTSEDQDTSTPSPAATKNKGKAIMQESEPPKKIKKKVQVQLSIDEKLAKKLFEEEQARFNAEQEVKFNAKQEQERIDFETALQLQKQLDERKEVVAPDHDIDWSDPVVLRYHAI
ncbi:hypothetical protein Tco_0422786 [Tanacetum coccineum]